MSGAGVRWPARPAQRDPCAVVRRHGGGAGPDTNPHLIKDLRTARKTCGQAQGFYEGVGRRCDGAAGVQRAMVGFNGTRVGAWQSIVGATGARDPRRDSARGWNSERVVADEQGVCVRHLRAQWIAQAARRQAQGACQRSAQRHRGLTATQSEPEGRLPAEHRPLVGEKRSAPVGHNPPLVGGCFAAVGWLKRVPRMNYVSPTIASAGLLAAPPPILRT